MHIVQFSRPIASAEWLSLLDYGAIPLEGISPEAVVYLIPRASINVVARLPFVRWVGAWRREYKLDLGSRSKGKPIVYVATLGPLMPEYRADLEQLGIQQIAENRSVDLFVLYGISDSLLQQIADYWWVRAVFHAPHEIPEQSGLNFSAMDSREFLLAPSLNSLGYNGTGVTVGVRDDGVFGSNTDSNSSHPDLFGIFHNASELTTRNDHGTHVAGIIAGRGNSSSGSIVGVATQSTVLFRGDGGNGEITTDLDIFRNNGVEISNHSYLVDCNFYNNLTEIYDRYADDHGFLVVKSAGNENGSFGLCQGTHDSITNPGTGKNVLAVGAISYTLDGTSGFGNITSYSSRGPTGGTVNRLKPELVAPGGDSQLTYGVVSTNGQSGEFDPTFVWPQFPPTYIRQSGTSMAAPHVAGALALMRQWSTPAISTSVGIKAHLIANTIPLKGNSNTPLNGYANTTYGYGLVAPFQSMRFRSGEWETKLFGTDTLTDSRREVFWTVNIPAGTRKVAVALAYDDTEGNGGNLNDDVDFWVELPSGRRFSTDWNGNNSSCTGCMTSPRPTGVNNESPIEKVVIDMATEGIPSSDLGQDWKVWVRFTEWPGWCVPVLCQPRQDIGIVLTAISAEPSLSLSLAQTSITAAPGQTVGIPVTVTNSGGYIIPAVGIEISGQNERAFLGPLEGRNRSVQGSLSLQAPSNPGTYPYTIRAFGVNLGLTDATASISIQVSTACSDQYEPNDTLSDAFGPIVSGSSTPGKICTSSDEDWFKVSVVGVGTISLTLTVPAGKDFDLDLYSGSGNLQARSVNGAGLPEVISFTTPGGNNNYFIKIYGFFAAFDTSNFYNLSYTFTPAPVLQVSPSNLSFTATQGGSNPATQSFNIGNGGGGTLNWTVTKTQPWLSLGMTSGTAPSTPAVFVNIAGLTASTYNDTITVTATGAQNSPQTVGVMLTVNPPPQAPAVTTGVASGVSSSGATLNGQVNPNGSATNGWFDWSTNSNLSGAAQTPQQPVGSDNLSHAITFNLTGLQLGTLYFFRAVASNSGGTNRGSIQSFTTLTQAPTVQTQPATGITSNSATLNGIVNPNGLGTDAWFRWGTVTDLSTFNDTLRAQLPGDNTNHAISNSVTGLLPSTTYFFRVVAFNGSTTVQSNILSFTTGPAPLLTLTVASTNPNAGIPVGATPADSNGTTSGLTLFALTYGQGTNITLTAPMMAPNGNSFASWTGCDSATGIICTVALNFSRAVTANYTTPPAPVPASLSFSPNPVVGGNNSTGTVTLSGAAPSGGVLVSLVSSDTHAVVPPIVTVSAGQNSSQFTMNTVPPGGQVNATITATANGVSVQAILTIIPVQRTLTVGKSGLGSGTVTSSVGGINCGPTCLTASATLNTGTQITLAASVPSGSASVFGGWSGGGCGGTGTCVITITVDTTVTATFNEPRLSRPTTLNFPPQVTGTTSAVLTIPITNTGTAPLNVTGVTKSGTNAAEFTHTNNCTTSVAPGASCTIQETFAPVASGARTATLSIASNAPGGPHSVTLSGTGTNFDWPSQPPAPVTVSNGGSAAFNLQLTPQGGFSGTITFACSWMAPNNQPPQGAGCTPPGQITLTTPTNVTVNVTTTRRSLLPPISLPRLPRPIILLWFWALLSVFAFTMWRRVPNRRPRLAPTFALCLVMLSGAVLAGCGGGSGGGTTPPPPPTGGGQTAGTPAGTYTLQVTASTTVGGQTVTRTIPLTLTVQ